MICYAPFLFIAIDLNKIFIKISLSTQHNQLSGFFFSFSRFFFLFSELCKGSINASIITVDWKTPAKKTTTNDGKKKAEKYIEFK